MDKEYKGLKENLERFKNELTDEKMRLLFSIAYKQGYDQALTIQRVSGSFLLRIILCPFIFIWGCILLAAGTLFPLPLLVIMSFYGLLLEPIIWLLQKSGSKINGIEPFIDDTGNNFIGHLLGFTIYFWGAFAIVYIYLKDGTVWSPD